MQQEGYDAHDFNLFDDRSSMLWRKPYVDGAVRELTAGDSRSQEQMRMMIERMMLAAGTDNPDVRHTTRKARRSRVNITIDDEDDQQDMLTDIRRKPGPSPPAQHILPRARGRDRPCLISPPSRSGQVEAWNRQQGLGSRGISSTAETAWSGSETVIEAFPQPAQDSPVVKPGPPETEP